MKKLLVFMMVLLVSGAIQAQGGRENVMRKSFLAFHAGPSFPVGVFADKTINPDSYFGGGGFAKTGYSLNLRYDYRFIKNLALAGSVFYNANKLKTAAYVDKLNELYYEETGEVIDVNGIKLDHWQWYGITVGPALLHDLGKNITGGLRVMGGIANANSPKLSFEGITIFGEDWAVAPVFQAGADLRIGMANNLFVFINGDYSYLEPKFEKEFTDPLTDEIFIEKGRQKMSVINVTAGIGIRF